MKKRFWESEPGRASSKRVQSFYALNASAILSLGSIIAWPFVKDFPWPVAVLSLGWLVYSLILQGFAAKTKWGEIYTDKGADP